MALLGVCGCVGPVRPVVYPPPHIGDEEQIKTQQQIQELRKEINDLKQLISTKKASQNKETPSKKARDQQNDAKKTDEKKEKSSKDKKTDEKKEKSSKDKKTDEKKEKSKPKKDEIELEKFEFQPTAKVTGRIHTDAVMATQSQRNKDTLGDLENATGFRRARLAITGTIGPNVKYIADFAFASGNVRFADMYLGVQKLPLLGEVRVGHFREPFSFEAQTSSNFFPFLERSAINSLDPARNWGVGLSRGSEDKRTLFQLGGFRTGSNSIGRDTTDQGDWAVTTRFTRLLWYDALSDGRSLMHAGGAFSHRIPLDETVNISNVMGSGLLGRDEDAVLTPFVQDVIVPAFAQQLYNIEWAWVHGPFSMQIEWQATGIDQKGGDSVFLHGGYVSVSYFLTGEHRAYNFSRGAFGRTKIISPFLCLNKKGIHYRGLGGWELVTRYDLLDFRDPNIPNSEDGQLVGSSLSQWTVGTNWYLNDYTRVMFNYQYIILDEPNVGYSVANLYSIRCQVAW